MFRYILFSITNNKQVKFNLLCNALYEQVEFNDYSFINTAEHWQGIFANEWFKIINSLK